MASNPLKVIEQGIKEGDWAKVVEGFNGLTGRKLKAPKSAGVGAGARARIEKPLVEAMSQAVALLSGALDTDAVEEEDEEPEKPARRQKPARRTKPRTRRARPVSLPEVVEDDDEEEEPSPFETPPAEAEAGGTTEERASEARAIARGERSLPDFTHVHDGTPAMDEDSELGRKCRTEPFRPGSFRNSFKDDGRRFSADKKVDRKLLRGLRPSRRRRPARKVKVKCFKCEKDYLVDPSLAPKTIKTKGTREGTNFVCDGCLKRAM